MRAGAGYQPTATVEVTTAGDSIARHDGAALLAESADRVGLTAATGWRVDRT
jgi:hypothetical protein